MTARSANAAQKSREKQPTPSASVEELRWRLFAAWWDRLLIVAVGTGMMLWTWGTWPDLIIDFGLQLYIPWRITEGQTLYSDIAYFGGVWPQYFNALVFRCFGVGLWTLIAVNFVIMIGIMTLLWRMLADVSSRFAASAALLFFVIIFAFSQTTGSGNYNYLCPYTHDLTHGLALFLVALWSVWRYDRFGLAGLSVAGFATGLAFLTRAELFLGGSSAVALTVLLTVWQAHVGRRRGLVMIAVTLGAAIPPPLIAFLALWRLMPARQALQGVLGSWVPVMTPGFTKILFYQRGLGTDHVLRNFGVMLVYFAAALAALGSASIVGRFVKPSAWWRWLVAAIMAAAITGSLAWFVSPNDYREAGRMLPLAMATLAPIWAWRLWSSRHDREESQKALMRISLVIFALGLMAKMILNCRVYQYGFVLAMPATMVFVIAMLDWIPRAIHRRGGAWEITAAVAVGLLALDVGQQLVVQNKYLKTKLTRIGEGRDEFWGDRRGPFVKLALERLQQGALPGETMAVIPEGVMLNYLARMPNPTPYTSLLPPEMLLFGEQTITEAFRDHPPDWVLAAERDTSEFDLKLQYIGRDYALPLVIWINAEYYMDSCVGKLPFDHGDYGIMLMKRKPQNGPR